MTETYLWAALALMHLLGAWVTYAAIEHYEKIPEHLTHWGYAALAFLCWEFVAIWTIFEKTAPHES